jgi:hypothetical protein
MSHIIETRTPGGDLRCLLRGGLKETIVFSRHLL